ncbi:MAG: phytanoyl-CoA dioxygenase, partial [Chloroflexi bacterium]|nr:phytanoyl-CoA dioxygenase [Chloroflexota bacterium]
DLRYQPTGQPTGRAFFPGFVARSRKDPSSELHDHAAWVRSWHEVREIFADEAMPKYNRWKSDAPWCA